MMIAFGVLIAKLDMGYHVEGCCVSLHELAQLYVKLQMSIMVLFGPSRLLSNYHMSTRNYASA